MSPTMNSLRCMRVRENVAQNIRTNWIGNDFPRWFGIGDDQGGADAGGIKIPGERPAR